MPKPKKQFKPEIMWGDSNGVWHMKSYGKRFIFDNDKPGWIIDPAAEALRIKSIAYRQKNREQSKRNSQT